jgi:hypothetical protein
MLVDICLRSWPRITLRKTTSELTPRRDRKELYPGQPTYVPDHLKEASPCPGTLNQGLEFDIHWVYNVG